MVIILSLIFCRGQDFEKASQLRDREMELKAQIQAITTKAKDAATAELESGEGGGPIVNDQDIANIVAQWTGMALASTQEMHAGLVGCSSSQQYVI